MSEEEWRAIPEWEGIYEASNHGRIKSLSRICPSKGKGVMRYAERIRKLQLNRYGYPVFSAQRPKEKPMLKSVHRAVVLAFIGPIPDKGEVNHKDGDKTNNRLDNLEICTRRENAMHMIDVLGKCVGNNHSQAILTEDGAREIVSLINNGFRHDVVAAAYGVGRYTICGIMRGKIWRRATGLMPRSFSFRKGVASTRSTA